MPDTLVWISGASYGLGAGLARTCPYRDARVVNLSRSNADGLDNVRLDLADPRTWEPVAEHFASELATFEGSRAIFVHNAFLSVPPSFVGEGGRTARRPETLANLDAALELGEAFIEAVLTTRPGIESGLVMISSAAARMAFEGRSSYCAAKAGMEQWVRVVRRERRRRSIGPWVVAVRPGFVDSPGARLDATYDVDDYPIAPVLAAAFETMDGILSPDDAARDIWAALPDGGPKESVLLFGAPPAGAGTA